MLTALDEKQAMLDGLSAGADDYIAKSSDLEILKARVRAQIRRRQFEDENRRIRDQLIHAEVEATEARTSRELAAVRATLIDELEQKNRELEAFSYSVSHDLRAPLRAIEGFSKILNQDYIECLPEQARHYQERILENAGKMGQLIDDLLAFSRLGRQPLNKSTVDLSVLAAEVLEDLRKETEGREVAISVGELPPGEADPLLLRQVLVNLLSNALKYTRKTPSARVEVGWTEEEGHAVYWVRDNGVGFNMKYSNKLFGVFQRLHRAEDFEGTGVGLALAQRIVHRHGGKIWASAEPDKGATFYFTLQGGDA
jgi:light-regulated signal transduction histidine kinase (bacteriophytochrome)